MKCPTCGHDPENNARCMTCNKPMHLPPGVYNGYWCAECLMNERHIFKSPEQWLAKQKEPPHDPR